MFLFVLQLAAIIISFALGDKIIDKIAKDDTQKQIEELQKNLKIVTYYCVGTLLLMLLEIMFTYCYIGSLRNRNFDYDYKFLNEDGEKLTLEQKQAQDRVKVSEKTDQKRRELAEKYPNYQKYR